MTVAGLVLSTLLIVVEAPPSFPAAEAESVERDVAFSLSKLDEEFRTLGDLSVLPESAPSLEEAASSLEEGVRLYFEVELDKAAAALERAIDLYEQVGAALWGANGMAKAFQTLGLVALANGDEVGAGGYFASALRLDPRMELESGTYAPEVVDAFDRVRAVFLEAGYQPRPAEIWGSAARRLSARAVVLAEVRRTDDGRTVQFSYLKVDPAGPIETKARATASKLSERSIRKAIKNLLLTAEGPKPAPKWRKWVWIGGGAAAGVIALAVAAVAATDRVGGVARPQTPLPTPTR